MSGRVYQCCSVLSVVLLSRVRCRSATGMICCLSSPLSCFVARLLCCATGVLLPLPSSLRRAVLAATDTHCPLPFAARCSRRRAPTPPRSATPHWTWRRSSSTAVPAASASWSRSTARVTPPSGARATPRSAPPQVRLHQRNAVILLHGRPKGSLLPIVSLLPRYLPLAFLQHGLALLPH